MKTLLLALLLQAAGGRPPQGAGLAPGEPAPAIVLKSPDGTSSLDLSKPDGRPLLLVFGSWT